LDADQSRVACWRSPAPSGCRQIPARRLAWASAYARAVTKVTFAHGAPVLPAAGDGPVPVMLASELTLARGGALDAALIARQSF
jgi:hypothetical protein